MSDENDLVCTRGKPSQPSQGKEKSLEINEKGTARIVDRPSQDARNPRMVAKKARRKKRKGKAITTSAQGSAPGGRPTEATAMWEGADRREVTRVVDPIDLMYRAKQIDAREYQAASAYREAAELLFSGYRCPLDQSVVAGSGGTASPTMAAVKAAAKLHEAARLLGMIDGCVVMLVAGEGMTVAEAAQKMLGGRAPSEPEAKAVGGRLRQALQLLATQWFPVRDRAAIVGLRRFDPKAMDTRLGEVMRGSFAHVTHSGIWEK